MALKTKVKVSGITNLSDARYCAGMGVHMLGFDFSTGSESYISPEKFLEIIEWISGPEIIAEFKHDDVQYVKKILEIFPFNAVESSDLSALQEISLAGLPLIARINLKDYTDLDHLKEDLGYIHDLTEFVVIDNLDTQVLDLGDLYALSGKYRLMAGNGLETGSIPEIIESIRIYGINLMGEQETRVGFKDYDEISMILEMIETEDPD